MTTDPEDALPIRILALRSVLGGVLMGLANLVPGISGGTMLLAAGVYPGFIAGIAEVTTLRFRLPSLLLLGTIVLSASYGWIISIRSRTPFSNKVSDPS